MLSFVLIFFLLMRLGYGFEVPISKFSRGSINYTICTYIKGSIAEKEREGQGSSPNICYTTIIRFKEKDSFI